MAPAIIGTGPLSLPTGTCFPGVGHRAVRTAHHGEKSAALSDDAQRPLCRPDLEAAASTSGLPGRTPDSLPAPKHPVGCPPTLRRSEPHGAAV